MGMAHTAQTCMLQLLLPLLPTVPLQSMCVFEAWQHPPHFCQPVTTPCATPCPKGMPHTVSQQTNPEDLYDLYPHATCTPNATLTVGLATPSALASTWKLHMSHHHHQVTHVTPCPKCMPHSHLIPDPPQNSFKHPFDG